MIELTGGPVEKWLNVELPKLQNPRADLLGETADGELVHVELQSGNDSTMALRMAEYGTIKRRSNCRSFAGKSRSASARSRNGLMNGWPRGPQRNWKT